MPGRASQEKLLSQLHHEVGLDPNETAFVEVRNGDLGNSTSLEC